MNRVDLMVEAARAAVGTPFRHQGRTVGRGIDCAGLMLHAVSAAGIQVADQSGYSRLAGGRMLEAALDSQPGIAQVHDDPRPGDILLMRFDGEPCHLAMLAGKTIIHAWAITRKVCEHGFTTEWQNRVVRVYRIAEDG